jgi:hypothetical protein
MGLLKTIIEERGVRSFKLRINEDPEVTAAYATLDGQNPGDHYAMLLDRADACLRAAGERGLDVIIQAHNNLPKGPDAVQREIYKWGQEISERHGHISEVGIAANFIVRVGYLSMILGDAPRVTWDAIFSICEAFHWLAFEEDGLHDLAVKGVGWKRGQTIAPVKARARKQAANEIIEAIYVKYCEGEPDPKRHKPINAAGTLIDRVNAELSKQGLQMIKEDTVRKAIGGIINPKIGLMAERANP